jgi:hypothetical protein
LFFPCCCYHIHGCCCFQFSVAIAVAIAITIAIAVAITVTNAVAIAIVDATLFAAPVLEYSLVIKDYNLKVSGSNERSHPCYS